MAVLAPTDVYGCCTGYWLFTGSAHDVSADIIEYLLFLVRYKGTQFYRINNALYTALAVPDKAYSTRLYRLLFIPLPAVYMGWLTGAVFTFYLYRG